VRLLGPRLVFDAARNVGETPGKRCPSALDFEVKTPNVAPLMMKAHSRFDARLPWAESRARWKFDQAKPCAESTHELQGTNDFE
jgi:hypothetical protein